MTEIFLLMGDDSYGVISLMTYDFYHESLSDEEVVRINPNKGSLFLKFEGFDITMYGELPKRFMQKRSDIKIFNDFFLSCVLMSMDNNEDGIRIIDKGGLDIEEALKPFKRGRY